MPIIVAYPAVPSPVQYAGEGVGLAGSSSRGEVDAGLRAKAGRYREGSVTRAILWKKGRGSAGEDQKGEGGGVSVVK